ETAVVRTGGFIQVRLLWCGLADSFRGRHSPSGRASRGHSPRDTWQGHAALHLIQRPLALLLFFPSSRSPPQVGAHGTGAGIPPVDEQVVAIKLVTPACGRDKHLSPFPLLHHLPHLRGTLHLTPEADPDLFFLARCGLGALGVVGEVELQAVLAHRLREETFVTTKEEIKRHHG
ncbi:unnamed protein product, partial [Closterium sp. NIES-54]